MQTCPKCKGRKPTTPNIGQTGLDLDLVDLAFPWEQKQLAEIYDEIKKKVEGNAGKDGGNGRYYCRNISAANGERGKPAGIRFYFDAVRDFFL